jgi:hypothetical protein
MIARYFGLALGAVIVFSTLLGVAVAEDSPSSVEDSKLKAAVIDWKPQTKAVKIDQERLTVRRLDVVDENGTIRMTLGAPAPQPIVGGLQYKRVFPVSGLVIYDKDGSERGGFGVADIEGSAVVAAQDHANNDAIGWRISPDGSVSFEINERAPITHKPALRGHIAPATGATRIKMAVAADGSPSIALADKQDRPRLRLSVTKDGFGAIEFLDAQGKVVDTIAPEALKKKH